MSLFPFVDANIEDETPIIEIPLAKEYDYDFVKGDFITRGGKPYLVEGRDAVRIWIHKALITERYEEIIHSWAYGNELVGLIGESYTQGLVRSEAERYTRNAVNSSLDAYVTEMYDFNVTYEGSHLGVEFTADTIYGEVKVFV